MAKKKVKDVSEELCELIDRLFEDGTNQAIWSGFFYWDDGLEAGSNLLGGCVLFWKDGLHHLITFVPIKPSIEDLQFLDECNKQREMLSLYSL